MSNLFRGARCAFKNKNNYNNAIQRRWLNFVPVVVEQVGHGERSYDIYSRLLKERIVCLMGQINDQLTSTIIAQLLFLQSQSVSKPVHVYINSPGGVVTAGLAIYDTMQFIKCPVSTWCVGQACSMASLLLASGERGMRYSLPNARIMLHQPTGGVQGQATDILIHAEEILHLKKQLTRLYMKHTGQESDRIVVSMERDCFMNPQDALEFGLVDQVLSGEEAEDVKSKSKST